MSVDRSLLPKIKDFGSLSIESGQLIVSEAGIPIRIINKGDEDVCMLTILFQNGDMEAPSTELTKLLTSLWREGTNNHSSDEIADRLDFYGAWMEITSSLHTTNVTHFCMASRLKELLPLLSDIILNPVFPNEPLDRMKAKLINALRINKGKVKMVSKDNMRPMIFGKSHPLAKKETEEAFSAVTSLDLKKQHKRIISSNPSIILAGKLNEDLINSVEKFADTIKIEEGILTSINEITPVADYSNKVAFELMTDKEQSSIIMNFPAIVRSHPDYNDLRITVMLLGGYFGSRLMSNIREEKGYTYGITASLVGYKEIGYVTVECECDNSYVENVISETKKELVRLAKEPVSLDELDVVKRMIKSSLASMMSDTFETAGYYVGQLSIGYPENYFYDQQQALENITPKRIMEIATKYLNPDNMLISIAGGGKDYVSA